MVRRDVNCGRSDKVKGRAELTLELDSLVDASGEERHLDTQPLRFEARSTKKDDAVKIGGACGVGALVGGIVGGKKGAAIGAGVGAGAGTRTSLLFQHSVSDHLDRIGRWPFATGSPARLVIMREPASVRQPSELYGLAC